MIESEILNILGVVVSFPMALIVFLQGFRPGGRTPYLAFVFLEAGLFFLIDLMKGVPVLSLILSFASAFYALPSLYLFARDVAGEPSVKPIRHYIPALVNVPVGTGCAILFAANGFRGGTLAAVYIFLLLAGQTLQIALYGRGAVSIAAGMARISSGTARTGSRNGGWLHRIVTAALSGYGLFLLLSWVNFAQDLAGDFMGRRIEILPGINTISVLAAVLVAWTIALCLLWGRDFTSDESRESRKYGGKPLPEGRAADLVAKARAYIEREADLASPDVSPRGIAEGIGEPYYLVSRAVNETAGMTLSDLVNSCRVERARRLLETRPDMSVLDIAFEAGFRSKSTFNDIFRKGTGLTPREFRVKGSLKPRE